MTKCAICKNEIKPATRTVSLVGGLFPESDPDFFMVDETVMPEAYTHLDCLLKLTARRKTDVADPSPSTGDA